MDGLEINSQENKLIISMDKNLFSFQTLNHVVDYLKLEALLNKANFSEEILEVGEQIKKDWWEKNKNTYLASDTYQSMKGSVL
jgi:hypothetical protein